MQPRRILLGVNIDHCATLRQARYRDDSQTCGRIIEPDPVAFALAAEQAGADGITVHLREDRRHIQERDVARLRECIRTRLNLEMAPTPEMLSYALELKPDNICLVPENRAEVTTEGGLNLLSTKRILNEWIPAAKDAGIQVSCFIDPDCKQIEAAAELASTCIELHTGAFARHFYYAFAREQELEKLRAAAIQAHNLGLTINAGHGLNYINIADICDLPWLNELNIGHSIISRSLYTGISEAVREMKACLVQHHQST